MEVCINAEQLRKALEQIEIAEKNGFEACLSIFTITKAGRCVSDCLAEHEGLILRAHPTDLSLDWGRICNQFIDDYLFIEGKLVDLACERDDLSPGRWAAGKGDFDYYYPDKDWDEYQRLCDICYQLGDAYLKTDGPDDMGQDYKEYCEDPDAYVAKLKARLAELPHVTDREATSAFVLTLVIIGITMLWMLSRAAFIWWR